MRSDTRWEHQFDTRSLVPPSCATKLCHQVRSAASQQIFMSTIQAIAFRRNQLRRVREVFPEIERAGVYVLMVPMRTSRIGSSPRVQRCR